MCQTILHLGPLHIVKGIRIVAEISKMTYFLSFVHRVTPSHTHTIDNQVFFIFTHKKNNDLSNSIFKARDLRFCTEVLYFQLFLFTKIWLQVPLHCRILIF